MFKPQSLSKPSPKTSDPKGKSIPKPTTKTDIPPPMPSPAPTSAITFQQSMAERHKARINRLQEVKARRSEAEQIKLAAMEVDRQRLLSIEKQKAKDDREARARERRRIEDERRQKEDARLKEKDSELKAENAWRLAKLKKGLRGLGLAVAGREIEAGRAREWRRMRLVSGCLREILEELRERFKDRKKLMFEVEMEADLRYIRTVKM